jgi:prepilin peptidase CpaA
MTLPPIIIQILLVLLVIPAAMYDLRTRRIPNWLCLVGLVLGIGLNAFLYENAGLWTALKGCGLAMAIYLPLWLLRGMGAGDVKLMAAIGAVIGPGNWLGILVLTSLIGGVSAIALVIAKHRIEQTLQNLRLILMSWRYRQAPYTLSPELDIRSDKGMRLPHAVLIAFGSLGFLLAAAIWAPKPV